MAKVTKSVCSLIRQATLPIKRGFTRAEVAPVQKSTLHERCILVDDLDRPFGDATKKDCHSVSPDGHIPLHRAFSVFLFNEKGEMLVQKRSSTKITFPNHYANTCCSHPLAEIPGETVEDGALGIKRAAQRRLMHELGIPTTELQPSDFVYITRFHYYAVWDRHWGEHEIDYVLIAQKNDVTVDPNPEEVSDIQWVSKSNIPEFIKTINCPITPWFQIMLKHMLPMWWDNLHSLKDLQDHETIHRFL